MEEKEELISHMQEIMGRIPLNARDILNVLVNPEVIEYTKKYIQAMDKASQCQKFEAPWSCAKEAEARYENIKYGWLGAGNGVGFEEWWCEPCRKKVMGT